MRKMSRLKKEAPAPPIEEPQEAAIAVPEKKAAVDAVEKKPESSSLEKNMADMLSKTHQTFLQAVEKLAEPKDDRLLVNIMATQLETTKILQELVKPKPLKKWHCTVSRSISGKIATVDIAEK